jgi:hypothetical protein
MHAEGPEALFDHAVGWLRKNRVLLPGVSVLARQVARFRAIRSARRSPVSAGSWGQMSSCAPKMPSTVCVN